MLRGIIRHYPGVWLGHSWKVLYEGTRIGVKLNRPWQVPINPDPKTCPFEKGEMDVIYTFPNGYALVQNKFTPHKYHVMVMPPNHWTEDQLRVLGGEGEILKALENIHQLAINIDEERWMHVYIGALAGQNVTHLHYHMHALERLNESKVSSDAPDELRRIEASEQELVKFLRDSPRHFNALGGLAIVIESIFRAGQCFIVPLADDVSPKVDVMACLLAKTIETYAKAFRSTQGMAPDFQLCLKFKGGRFIYGSYLPILNHHGTTETVGAIHSGGPFVHPWTPEETLEHLQKFL